MYGCDGQDMHRLLDDVRTNGVQAPSLRDLRCRIVA
jgi:hypothetical protein